MAKEKSHTQDALETLREKFDRKHEFKFHHWAATPEKPNAGYCTCTCGWSSPMMDGPGEQANAWFAEHVSNHNRERHIAETALEAIKGL